MGRARGGTYRAGAAGDHGRRGLRHAALEAALRRRGLDGLGGVSRPSEQLDERYRRLAASDGWHDRWAVPSLRLVDALWCGEHEEFGQQAYVLRRTLEAEGLSHDGVRVAAGLAVMHAQRTIADVHGVEVSAVRRRLKEQAAIAKELHVFPWHLLDG
jgi:hypothetical protein